jgi:hypothetical protein
MSEPAPGGTSGRTSGTTRSTRAKAQPRKLGGGFATGTGHQRGGTVKASPRPRPPRPAAKP